jgi:hypothetical protein
MQACSLSGSGDGSSGTGVRGDRSGAGAAGGGPVGHRGQPLATATGRHAELGVPRCQAVSAGRAAALLAGPFGQISPPFLQPVPQRQRGPAVILDVPGHDALSPGVARGCPIFQCRRERDQVGYFRPQVHLSAVPAQRLQPLDRVALHPGLHALPDDPVQVDEHPRAGTGDDSRLAYVPRRHGFHLFNNQFDGSGLLVRWILVLHE